MSDSDAKTTVVSLRLSATMHRAIDLWSRHPKENRTWANMARTLLAEALRARSAKEKEAE